MTEPLAYP